MELALPTPDDLATYDHTFALRNIGGYVDGNTAREVFMASQLPNDVLSAIWRLSDMDGDSQLSHREFRIAMHVVMQSFRYQVPVPAQLPPAVLSVLCGQPLMGQPSVGEPPQMGGFPPMGAASMGGPPLTQAPAEDWVLPPDAAARWAGAFQKACQECGQPTLGKADSQLNTWALSVDILLHLWSIADVDGDDRLDLREYLIICRLAQRCSALPTLPPPPTLPPDLLVAVGVAVQGTVQGGCCASGEFGAQDGFAAPGDFAALPQSAGGAVEAFAPPYFDAASAPLAAPAELQPPGLSALLEMGFDADKARVALR